MPKAYAVTPMLRPGKRTYSATYRNASGNRVTGSLKTEDRSAAALICAGLVSLFNVRAKSFEEVPAGTPPESVKLYFGIRDENALTVPTTQSDLALPASIQAELERFPVEARVQALLILKDRYTLQHELENTRVLCTGFKNSLAKLQGEYDSLKRSVVARVAESAENVPALVAALDLFEQHLQTTTTRANTKIHVALAKKFAATLPSPVKNMADVRPDLITKFIDEETARTSPDKPLARRRNLRIRLARFVNWSAQTYGYPSQMTGVANVKRNNLRRERGEIVWHELQDVEAALTAIPAESAIYWRALVATLAYAGLQLAELCWLRKSDLDIKGERARIWVGPVTDSTDTVAKHLLKTGNRERHVDVHPKHLLPRLKDYLTAGLAGDVYLFPMLARTRTRMRKVNRGVSMAAD